MINPSPIKRIPDEELEFIEIEHMNDDVWEFAVWRGETQLVLGHRPTLLDAMSTAKNYAEDKGHLEKPDRSV